MLGAAFNVLRGLTGWAFRGTIATAGAGAATLGAQGFYAAQTGNRSWFNQILGWGGSEVTAASAAMEQEGMWMGLYSFLEHAAQFIQNITNGRYGQGLEEWALEAQGLESPEETSLATDGSLTTPTLPDGVTSENAITIDNLRAGYEDRLDIDLGHKLNVLGHGLADGGVQAVSLVGHAFDAADSVVGWGASLIGIDTGHNERDASAWMYRNGMSAVNGVWDATIGVPELTTAWDRMLHGAGELGGAAITGYGLASGLTAVFTRVAGTSAALGATAGLHVGAAQNGSNFLSRIFQAARFGFAGTSGPISATRAGVATAGWSFTPDAP